MIAFSAVRARIRQLNRERGRYFVPNPAASAQLRAAVTFGEQYRAVAALFDPQAQTDHARINEIAELRALLRRKQSCRRRRPPQALA
jgi:hypothetical protein